MAEKLPKSLSDSSAHIEPAAGMFWQIATTCLWIKAHMAYGAEFGYQLDQSDAMLEARYFNETLNGTPKHKTGGFNVVTPPGGYKR